MIKAKEKKKLNPVSHSFCLPFILFDAFEQKNVQEVTQIMREK